MSDKYNSLDREMLLVMVRGKENRIREYLGRAEAAEAKLLAVVKDCAGCLRTAAEDIQDWGKYADDYFQRKHGLKADVERYRNKADELAALLKKENAL